MTADSTLAVLANLALDDTAPEPFRIDLARSLDRLRIARDLATDATTAARTALDQRDTARRTATADLIEQLAGKKPNPNPLAIIEQREHLDRRHAQAVEVAALTTAAANRLTADATAGVFTRHAPDLLAWIAAYRHARPLPELSSPGHRYAWDRIGSRFLIDYPHVAFPDRDTPPLATALALDVDTSTALAERTQYAWDAIATGDYHPAANRTGPAVLVPHSSWESRRPVEPLTVAVGRASSNARPMVATAR